MIEFKEKWAKTLVSYFQFSPFLKHCIFTVVSHSEICLTAALQTELIECICVCVCAFDIKSLRTLTHTLARFQKSKWMQKKKTEQSEEKAIFLSLFCSVFQLSISILFEGQKRIQSHSLKAKNRSFLKWARKRKRKNSKSTSALCRRMRDGVAAAAAADAAAAAARTQTFN